MDSLYILIAHIRRFMKPLETVAGFATGLER